MTLYAHTSNATPIQLPNKFVYQGKLIMGLKAMDDSALAAIGWYPVRYEALEPGATGYDNPVLDEDAGEYVVPSLPVDAATALADAKAAKQFARAEALIAAREGGFQFNGEIVASDLRSWLLIQGAVTNAQLAIAQNTQEALDAFSAALGAGWRAANQTIVATTAADMIAMNNAFLLHIAACDVVGQAHKAAIEACETVAEVATIDVTSNYPNSGENV